MFISQQPVLLAELRLTTLEAVKTYQSPHLVKNHRGHRDILRIHTILDGAPTALFLKRLWKVPKKDGLKSILQHRQVRSRARQEALNYQALASAGIGVPRVISFGEENSLLWERFSFILTAAAPGKSLEDFLRAHPAGSLLRRQTLHALALFIRKLHDAGLFSPDLFTRHVFISFSSERVDLSPVFTLIDMARLDQASPGSLRLRARDLAALNITAPLSRVTRSERIRFLQTYDVRSARSLFPRIQRRVQYLLKRAKYKPFLK